MNRELRSVKCQTRNGGSVATFGDLRTSPKSFSFRRTAIESVAMHIIIIIIIKILTIYSTIFLFMYSIYMYILYIIYFVFF